MRLVDLAPAGPFAVIALVLWGAGLLGISEARDFAASARPVSGVVVRLEWSKDYEGDFIATPVVRFEVEGRSIEVRGSVGSSPPAHHVGEVVEVMVPPGHPEAARLWGFHEQFLFPVIILAAGLPFGIAAIAAASWAASRRRALAQV